MALPLPPTDEEPRQLFFILDEDGRTICEATNYVEWQAWMDTDPDRRVAKTLIDGYRVSTIFWGVAEYGPDKLFETMLFMGDCDRDLAAWRCSSWEEAGEQHERACAWAREQLATGALKPVAPDQPFLAFYKVSKDADDDELGALTN